MPSLYRFSDYSLEWPLEFEREAERLESLLGGELAIVHHIGSTSVPGLAAKPVIRTSIDISRSAPIFGATGSCGRNTRF